MAFWNNRTGRFSSWTQSAFSDRFFWLFFFVWLILLVGAFGYILFNFNRLPMEIPLFYSRVWGQSQLAKTGYIYLPLAGVFLLGIFNFSLAVNFHQNDRVLSYLAAGASSLIAILAFLTTFNIINLVH